MGKHQTKRSTRSNFQKGAGVFNCRICGNLTRGQGDSIDVLLCGFCYEESSLENLLSDGHITQEEFKAKLAALRAEYGRAVQAPAVPQVSAQELWLAAMGVL